MEHNLRGKIAEVVDNFEHVTQFQIETPILEGGHLAQVQYCDTKRKLQKTDFYGKDFQAITIVCGQLSDYKRILYIQKHSSTVSVTILAKGMVTRNQ